jgi:hypothetical protein
MHKKLITGVIVVAMVLGLAGTFVAPASAQTTTVSGSFQFTRNLTVGSMGADVAALQVYLNAKGFMVASTGAGSPGRETNYFGGLTRAALARFQASVGIAPAVGYFGPITRAYVNSNAAVGTPPNPGPVTCPAGYTCTPAGGTGTTTPASDTISTPGREGIMTVTRAPLPANGQIVREGELNKGVLGLRVRATNSDILVQRVRVNLGTSTLFQNRIASRVTLWDGSTMLASANTNASVRDNDSYILDLSGFSRVVRAGAEKDFTVAIDVYNTVDTANTGSQTLTVPAFGVRAVDGAGFDLTGPSSPMSATFTVEKSQTSRATLNVFRAQGTPTNKNIISDTDGRVMYSAGNADNTTVLMASLRAERDRVLVRSLTASTTRTAGTAMPTSIWLFDGSNVVGSAAVTASSTNANYFTATFTNLDMWVERDSTRTLTMRAEFTGATTTASTFVFALNAPTSAENSVGESVTVSGSATSDPVNVLSKGPVFSFGTPTASKDAAGNNATQQSMTGRFPVTVTAVNADIELSQNAGAAFQIRAYQSNATATSTINSVAYDSGISGLQVRNGRYVIPQGSTVSLVVSAVFAVPNATPIQQYQLVLEQINSVIAEMGGTATTSNTTTYTYSNAPKTNFVALP